jgi:NosR/NirI family nitrous oxide reductase transcriptional regulator
MRLQPMGYEKCGLRAARVLFTVLLALSLICTWIIGTFRQPVEVTPFFKQVLGRAERFERAEAGVYVGYVEEGEQARKVGYVATGSALGYAGPIDTVVGMTQTGRIAQVAIARQTETFAFFHDILDSAFLESVIGKHCADPFQIGDDIQAVTGATVSLQGLTEAIQAACHRAAQVAHIPVKARDLPPITMGFPELILLSLLGMGFLAYGRAMRRYRRVLQWIGLGLGLALLGVWLNRPMSLIHINVLLMGYWPQWQTHLYWYLLVVGVLMPIVLTGRNVYCSDVCPLGAVQQALGALSGTRIHVPRKIDQGLRWGQRILAWLAVVCALATRNPTIIHYDVSGPLFSLNGATWQFALLALVLVTSLALMRPWCNYLCPIRVLTDFIRLVRRCLGRLS